MNPRLEQCSAVEEALPRYVGGELLPDRQLAVDRHLRACAACRAAAARANAARSALLQGMVRKPERPIDLWSGVRAGLVKDGVLASRQPQRLAPARTSRRAWRLVPIGGLAAAAALGALWLQLSPTIPQSPVGPVTIDSGTVAFEPSPLPGPAVQPQIAITPVSDKLQRLKPSDAGWASSAVEFAPLAPPGPGMWSSYRNPNLGSPAGLVTPGKTH